MPLRPPRAVVLGAGRRLRARGKDARDVGFSTARRQRRCPRRVRQRDETSNGTVGHPCGEAYTTLRHAGHELEVIKSYGLRMLPDIFNRTEAKRLTGSRTVAVLVTCVRSDSSRIGSEEVDLVVAPAPGPPRDLGCHAGLPRGASRCAPRRCLARGRDSDGKAQAEKSRRRNTLAAEQLSRAVDDR